MPEEEKKPVKVGLLEHFFRRFFDALAVAMVLVLSAVIARNYNVLPQKFDAFGFKGEFVAQALENTKIDFTELADSFDKRLASNEADLRLIAQKLEDRGELEVSELSIRTNPGQSSVVLDRLRRDVARDKVSAGAAVELRRTEPTRDKIGYVWLGTYDNLTGAWLDTSIENIDGTPVSGKPSALSATQQFKVSTDLNLRDGAPSQSERYYRDLPKLGYVPEGSAVKLLEAPLEYESNSGTQLWARVEAPVWPVSDL